MKISQDMRAQVDTSTKNGTQVSVSGNNFGSVVRTQTTKLQQEELQRLMKTLNMQGERLAKSRSLQDLAKYKRMVKNFVKEAVQYGMNLKHSHGFNLDGHSRKLITVEKVDEKLVELTEAVIAQEKHPLDLLGLLGEIKGLLINIYT